MDVFEIIFSIFALLCSFILAVAALIMLAVSLCELKNDKGYRHE